MGLLACQGALCVCPFGMAPSSLNVLPVSNCFTPPPLATIQDNIPFVNVAPFAMCTSLMNPAVAAATAAAWGALTPMPCTPVPAGPWIPAQFKVLIKGVPALDMNSKLMCAYGGMISITFPGQVKVMTL